MTAVFTLIAMMASSAAAPQAEDAAAKGQKVAALKESLAANQAALKSYTWTETTEISMKGEVKKKEQKLCRYGADGKVQKTPIGDQPAPKQEQSGGGGGRRGGGRMKEHVVEKKVGEIKDYMGQVAALVKEYVPPDKDKIQAAQTAGQRLDEAGSVRGNRAPCGEGLPQARRLARDRLEHGRQGAQQLRRHARMSKTRRTIRSRCR